MPTPVAAARQCLAPAAVAALDAAVVSARRRAHAQTSSLHLMSSLLAPPAPPLLRDALARARSAAYPPRAQLKALELCFAVSLDRLPSVSSSSSSGAAADEPPLANSLMAAIKRAQASQRRNPDTFHFYHQAATAQAPSAVKVELSQLVLAILDDPVVSRVFDDAGFRSGDIKLAVLRPTPPMPLLSRLPSRGRQPPLFLCSFAAADDADVPSPAGNLAGPGEEHCRQIVDVLSRGRNPMLVGAGAASAAADFVATSPYRVLPVGPNSIEQTQLGVAAAMAGATSGLIISIGDLGELAPDDGALQETGGRVVAEVTRVLETHKAGRVWVMGWSATYVTYMNFLLKFPMIDKDWEIQVLPITPGRAAGTPAGPTPPATSAAPFSKPASLMQSVGPFGGLVHDSYEASSITANSGLQDLWCQHCNDRYEQEVATIIRGSGITSEDHRLGSMLRNGGMMGPNNGFDAVKVRDDQMVLNSKILNLQKKWKEYCLRLHKGQNINRDPYQLFPQYIGVPVIRERAANPNKLSESVASQVEVITPSAVFASHTNTTTKIVLPPSISDKRNEDLILKLQVRHSKSDKHLQGRGVQPRHESLSNSPSLEVHEPPSSAVSVATDLVLGTPRESFSKGTTSACREHVEDAERSIHLIPSKVNDFNLKPPQLIAQPYSCSQGSTNVGQASPPSVLHPAASVGMSAFGQWQRPSHLAAQGSDLSNYKLLMQRLFKIVGRQEEALSAICGSIVRCRSMERRRGANLKKDIWFSFQGSDSMAKRTVAIALAELMLGSKENMIYLDLSLQDWDYASLRRKNGTDYIVEELRNKRRSVIFLDNIDEADGLVHDRVSHAIETGRFQDSRGVEVDIKDSIVVLSTRMIGGCKNVDVEENHTFSEEKILAARGKQLKIFLEPGTGNGSRGPGGKVVVSLRKTDASLSSGSVSKRKLNVCGDQEKLQESPSISKRLHRTSNVQFDLNLSVDEDGSDDDSNSDDASSGNRERSLDGLLSSVDERIDFKPFGFGKLANDILQEFHSIFSSILGSYCTLEIDGGAMEQILAASWTSDGKRPLQAWLEQVFAGSLHELKRKCGGRAISSTLRLVACEERVAAKEYDGFGALLPSTIILEC